MRFTPLDSGLARDRFAEQQERLLEQRKAHLAAAYWAAMYQREHVRETLRGNKGLWLPEFAPLSPHERTELLIKLRHDLGLPADPRMRPAEGAVRPAGPDLARPE